MRLNRKLTTGTRLKETGILLKVILTVGVVGLTVWMIISAHMAGAVGVAPTIRGATSATLRYTVSPKTIATPTTAAGDLLILIFVADTGSVTDMQLPSGFTEVARREFNLNSNHMIIATKTATGSEPASYTYVAPTNADTRVDLISVKDPDPSNLPVISTSETPASATTHAAPNVTPAGVNDLLISGVALMSNPSNPGATTWTAPSGMTEVTDAQTSTILTMTTASQTLTGGPTGKKTFTATAGTAVKGIAFSIAINGVGDVPNAVPTTASPSVRDKTIANVPYTVANPKTIATPTTVAGDLLVMVFLSDYGTIDDMVVPTGFTTQYRLDRGLNKNHMVVATKVATGSEPTSYSYSAEATADTRVDLLSIKDADTVAPLVGNGVVPTTSVNYLTAPSLVPLGTNDLLISSANLVSYPVPGATTWTAPFGMTKLTDAQTTNLSMTTAVRPLTAGGETGGRTFLAAPQTPQPGDAFSVAVKGMAGNSQRLYPDGMTGGWSSGTYTDIDEGDAVTSDYLQASGTTTTTATFSVQSAANITQATSITLRVCAYSATNANGGQLDTITNNIAGVGGTPVSFTTTPLYSATGVCKWEQQTYYGSWTQAQIDALQMTFTRALQGTGSNSAKADDVRIVSAYATVVYSSPPVVSQVAYRWFGNDTGGALGAPLAANNTSVTAPAPGTAARLRLNLGVGTGDLDAGTTYKLRYQLKSGTCGTNPSLYSDVTTSSPIQFYDNTSLTDASLYSSSANDPTRAGVTAISQTYQESNSFKAVTPVLKNQDGLWDMSLTTATGLAPGSTYCLMVTQSDNSALGNYTVIPELTLPAPTQEQSNYRFYQNTNSVTPGSPLAAQNTKPTVTVGTPFRLRQLLRQTSQEPTTSSSTFKLQAGEKVSTCSAASFVTLSDGSGGAVQSTGFQQTASTITGAPDSFGNQWNNPSDAKLDDNILATHFFVASSKGSAPLNPSSYGFSIPSNATIQGIEFQYQIGAAVRQSERFLYLKQGATSSGPPSTTLGSLAAGTTYTRGGPTDLWGLTWTPADINSSTFGATFATTVTSGTATPELSIDYMALNVYYSLPAGSNFTDNANVSDEAAISSFANDPTPTSGAVTPQTYSENASFGITTTIQNGENGLWDFSLRADPSLVGKTYCYRVVNSDGSPLVNYAQYPEVTFAAAGPTLTQQLRGGQSVINGVKRPFIW